MKSSVYFGDGEQRKTVYDFVGRLAEAYNLTSAGATYSKAVYTYTTRDLLESIKHYNNSSPYQERTFSYDGYGRLTGQTTPEAGTVSYEYFGNDQVSKVTDARSLYAEFTYNNRGLLTVVNYSDSTPDVNYTYGEYGERTLMEEKNTSGTVIASTSYSYDSYKRLDAETRSFNGLSGTYSVGYDYNYVGALKQISYAADFPSPVTDWSKSVNYDYNYAGGATTVGTNLRSGSTTNNVVTALNYRAWGALQKADFANGRRLALGYDPKRSQLASLELRKTDNTDVVSNLSYDYYNGGNNNGRIQKITDADTSYTTTFGYDDYNRLTSASASAYTRSYSYDNWGNLTGVTSTGAGESGSCTLSYAANGRCRNPFPAWLKLPTTGYNASTNQSPLSGKRSRRVSGYK